MVLLFFQDVLIKAQEGKVLLQDLYETVQKLQSRCRAVEAKETYERIKEMLEAMQREAITKLAQTEKMALELTDACQPEVANGHLHTLREVPQVKVTPPESILTLKVILLCLIFYLI
jgi:hypothetical protein